MTNESDFLTKLGSDIDNESKPPPPTDTLEGEMFDDRRRHRPPAGFKRNRIPSDATGGMGEMVDAMTTAHTPDTRTSTPASQGAKFWAPDVPDRNDDPFTPLPPPISAVNDMAEVARRQAESIPNPSPADATTTSEPRRRWFHFPFRRSTSTPPAQTPEPTPTIPSPPLRPSDIPPITPEPPDHLHGTVVHGPSSRNIPETLRNALRSTFTKETALFVGAVGTGLAARKLEEMTGISPDVIANIARFVPVVGSVTASLTGVGGVFEMRGLQRAANAKSERAEEVWQKNMNTWRRVRRISEFIALASFADKIASAGHAVENAFAHAISNHGTEPTPTPHVTSTPHKTEIPTTTPVATRTEHPATATSIPTPTEPHGGLGTNTTPTATSTPDTGPATPTPTHSPTPVPTITPGVPGVGGNHGGTGHEHDPSGGIGGGSPTPLEVHGFNIGANAVSAVVEHPHITPPHTPDNPIAGPGRPGLDPGITPPTEAPPVTGAEALAHFDFTAHGHHITGNAYDNSYMFDDKHWNLEGNFTDHFIDIPQGMHIDHTALQTALNQFVDGYANDTLQPGSVAYDVGHYANGTSSVYDQIAHNPEFRQHLIDAHILVPDEPAAAVTPDIHPVSPLVASHAGEDTPPQTTAQVVDKITALHASADSGSDQVDKLATIVAHHQADISTAAPTVSTDTPPGTTSDTTQITPPLGNGSDFPLNAGTETFPADTQAGTTVLPEFHTGPIDHITAQTGIIVNGELGNTDHPLTYGEAVWDLQNPTKEAEAYQTFIHETGLPVDQQTFHHALEELLNDAAYTWSKGELDDTSPKGLLFHWFNGTESMQLYFDQNPSAVRESFEKLAEQYPQLIALPEQPSYTNIPPLAQAPNNVVPFPGQAANVIPFPNRTNDDKVAA